MLAADALSGLTAGLVSTLAMHPLDLVKTRLQIGSGTTVSLLKTIYSTYGLRGLYRGLGINLCGGALGWSFYFAWYGQLKSLFGPEKSHLTASQYLLSSAAAGFLTSLCTNPIWVVKTRMLTTNRNESHAYSNFVRGLWSITQKEGMRGLYRGLVPSLFGVSHGALQFTAYEKLKDWHHSRYEDQPLTSFDYLRLSAASKAIAVVATYPYQVLRSRLQMHNADPEATVISTFRLIRKTSGLQGFYRGLTLNFFRVVPATCITMLCYEHVNKLTVGLMQRKDQPV